MTSPPEGVTHSGWGAVDVPAAVDEPAAANVLGALELEALEGKDGKDGVNGVDGAEEGLERATIVHKGQPRRGA